jgi:uncharacterized protein (DUF433 family)
MTLKDLEAQLSNLTPAEKAQALKMLVLELTHTWPGIEKTPGVAGGEACIVRTRIPVWVLEGYRRLGWSEARILESYPTLRAADLVNAWAYVDAHKDEIEVALKENEEA